jgi:DNA repair exonuclease SbcCD ATPase subunit
VFFEAKSETGVIQTELTKWEDDLDDIEVKLRGLNRTNKELNKQLKNPRFEKNFSQIEDKISETGQEATELRKTYPQIRGKVDSLRRDLSNKEKELDVEMSIYEAQKATSHLRDRKTFASPFYIQSGIHLEKLLKKHKYLHSLKHFLEILDKGNDHIPYTIAACSDGTSLFTLNLFATLREWSMHTGTIIDSAKLVLSKTYQIVESIGDRF